MNGNDQIPAMPPNELHAEVGTFVVATPTVSSSSLRLTSPAQILQRFYQMHNPEKISEVPTILERWKGREKLLFTVLNQKYDCTTIKVPPLNTVRARQLTSHFFLIVRTSAV
jgi:hypothetical protein